MIPSLAQRTVLLTSRSATDFIGVREVRTDIEALRAIAILLVVAFHCHFSGIPGGFVGVDVFYVLSGYLITGLLVTETEKTSSLNFLRFYAKRIRRLLPAAALVLLTTLIVGALVFSPRELTLTAHAARANALYMSNMYFARSASDYFSARVIFNPLLHTWSLSVEEQFYLFWPLLIALGLLIWRSRNSLLVSMALLTIVCFGINLYASARIGATLPLVWSVAPARLGGFLFVAIPMLLTGRLRLTRAAAPLVIVIALAEMTGTAAYAFGAREGIAIAAVMSSQFGAIAAIASVALFGERLERHQVAGIGIIAAGVATLAALQAT